MRAGVEGGRTAQLTQTFPLPSHQTGGEGTLLGRQSRGDSACTLTCFNSPHPITLGQTRANAEARAGPLLRWWFAEGNSVKL